MLMQNVQNLRVPNVQGFVLVNLSNVDMQTIILLSGVFCWSSCLHQAPYQVKFQIFWKH
jgi:hypothetical protein